MSALNLELAYCNGDGVTVDGDEGHVGLTLWPEVDTEQRVSRVLTSEEARALAAALVHFAAEVER